MGDTMKKTQERIAFSLKAKELCSISVEGIFPGEITATKELLAYENKVKPDDIKVRVIK